jgi:hypothetical protein
MKVQNACIQQMVLLVSGTQLLLTAKAVLRGACCNVEKRQQWAGHRGGRMRSDFLEKPSSAGARSIAQTNGISLRMLSNLCEK